MLFQARLPTSPPLTCDSTRRRTLHRNNFIKMKLKIKSKSKSKKSTSPEEAGSKMEEEEEVALLQKRQIEEAPEIGSQLAR